MSNRFDGLKGHRTAPSRPPPRHRLLGGHRRLLFRTYLLLVAGVMAVAIVLEIGRNYLESTVEPAIDPWVDATLQLIDARLADTPAAQREGAARDLAAVLGIPIRLLDSDEVARNALRDKPSATFVDGSGDTFYLYRSAAREELIYLGPVAPPKDNALLQLVSPAFYLGVFVLASLWLRPLLRDIDVISSAATRFSADYREPTQTVGRTSELTVLAANVDAMSSRLSGLIQSQKELIAALSHEMRTPLARIRFALAVADKNADETLRKRLEAVNTDVREIDELIATMLDYARLDHPDLSMSWQAVPTDAFAEEFERRYANQGKILWIESRRTPATIDMDRRLMTLAISNLLSNAMRYARQKVRLTLEASGEEFAIAVEDDGHGVPNAERDTVFKAFTRLDDSRTRETGGYGLGLAIVARIAALHGGSATVDTAPQLCGARFRIAWPRQPA